MSPKLRPQVSLPPEKLHANWPQERIPWEDSDKIPRAGRRKPAQPRVLQALELGLRIHNHGYNIYFSGEADLGRTYMLQKYLEPRAKKEATPPDLLYVNNFDDADQAMLLKVPAGQGKLIKQSLARAILQVRKELPTRFEATSFVRKRGELLNGFHDVKSKLMNQMESAAEEQGFNLDMDENGSLTLYPVVDGKRLSNEEYDRMNSDLRNNFKRKSDSLLKTMPDMVRKLARSEKDFRNQEKSLEREVVESVLDRHLSPVAEKACRAAANNGCAEEDQQNLQNFFERMRADMLDNADFFIGREVQGLALDQVMPQSGEQDPFRYDVNLFVDNSRTKGAPIITENHPSFSNLLGCVEREAEMGALVTDFTLIKAGSLHRANGGYLILHVEDILHQPGSWEGLVRALRSGQALVEEGPDGQEGVRTKGIEPQPLDLNLKVLLVGEEDLRETLLLHDERFSKLFKIKAQMTSTTERTTSGVLSWLHNLAPIIDEAGLLPFDRAALARLVDFGSWLCEDQRKLSLKFPLVREVMIEASAMADMEGSSPVTRDIVNKALEGRMYRANLVEELFMEEYDRDLIKISTSGESIGLINALAVGWNGEFEFGLPHQISCTVGVGHGGIVDLEREAELGGPIHTKAMMILKSYLVDQFAHNKPLVLTGSLCFEQSYHGVEGDSASGAELAALLSAISGVPLRQSLAFTGAVNQSGQIMAIGGATCKIEGFFSLCARRGLTGKQGIILPRDNIDQLMLGDKVRDAVAQGKFHIYPVGDIGQALELLTGLPTGKRHKDGTFPSGSLYYMVDSRLREFVWLAEHAGKSRRGKKAKV